jgi:hypothetical protein
MICEGSHHAGRSPPHPDPGHAGVHTTSPADAKEVTPLVFVLHETDTCEVDDNCKLHCHLTCVVDLALDPTPFVFPAPHKRRGISVPALRRLL